MYAFQDLGVLMKEKILFKEVWCHEHQAKNKDTRKGGLTTSNR